MTAVENRFTESSGSLVKMTEDHGEFIIHAVCGEHDGEDVHGFIITDAGGEVLDAGGIFDKLLIESDAIIAAEEAELNAIGSEEGDNISSKTESGVDQQGYSVTIDTEYSVNGDGEQTKTITRSVTDGEGLVSGTVTVVVTDSDGTRIIDSITDLDGNEIETGNAGDDKPAEGDTAAA